MAKLVKITKLTMVYVDKYSFHGGHNIVALTFFTKERMKKWGTPRTITPQMEWWFSKLLYYQWLGKIT